jgi:hypothetical protein
VDLATLDTLITAGIAGHVRMSPLPVRAGRRS